VASTSKRKKPAPRAPKPTTVAKPKASPRKTANGPDMGAGVEPSVRIFTELSLDRIIFAEMAADAGNFRPAADICDWLLADDRIGGLLHTRAQSLLGIEPSFDESGDKRRSKTAVNALDAKEDYWASYPESELTLMVVWGILLGFAPMKHTWVRSDEHGGRLLPKPVFWHPQHLRRDPSGQWKTRVALASLSTSGTTEIDLNPGDGTFMLHTPYGTHRPVAYAAWRGLARWALIKHLAMWDKSRLGEKGSLLVAETQPGMILPTSTETSTKDQRAKLAADLYARGREGVAVLPPGYNVKLVESLGDSRSLYDSQIALANEAFAITIRGGNLTTQVSGGSLAAAEVQERVSEDAKRRFDAISVQNTLHDQSLIWWAQFNFGDRRIAPWPNYPVRGAEDYLKKAQALDVAMDGAQKARRLGFVLKREAFADAFGMEAFLVPEESVPDPGSAEDIAQNPEPPPPPKPVPPPAKGAVPPPAAQAA